MKKFLALTLSTVAVLSSFGAMSSFAATENHKSPTSAAVKHQPSDASEQPIALAKKNRSSSAIKKISASISAVVGLAVLSGLAYKYGQAISSHTMHNYNQYHINPNLQCPSLVEPTSIQLTPENIAPLVQITGCQTPSVLHW